MAPDKHATLNIQDGAQRRQTMDKGKQVWRRIGEQERALNTTIGQGNGPFAQVGEPRPPEPAARSPNSSEISASTQPPAEPDNPTSEEHEHQGTKRNLNITLSEELLNKLRATCKTSVSLLGRIQGKHPGLQTLTVAHLSKGMPETPRAQGEPRSDTRDLWRRW
jgi:hypothetical protein